MVGAIRVAEVNVDINYLTNINDLAAIFLTFYFVCGSQKSTEYRNFFSKISVIDFKFADNLQTKWKRKSQAIEVQSLGVFKSVRDEIRTHTALRPLPPQSSVSTNSTTRTKVQTN